MKKIISGGIVVLMIVSNLAFAMDLSNTANYLGKQKLDEWGILALYNSGANVSNKNLAKVDASKITTDYEAYIVGAKAQGKDVSDYAKKIISTQRKSGKFADCINGNGEDLINSHIWGVIALYLANNENYNKAKALTYLKSKQNKDGGFAIYSEDTNSDIDMTCMGIVALNILGLNGKSNEIKNALTFVESNLDKRESCESLSWYIVAKIKLGMSVEQRYIDKIMSYKLEDGSFKHLKSNAKGNYMATHNAFLALCDYNNKTSVFNKLHNLNIKMANKNIKKKAA